MTSVQENSNSSLLAMTVGAVGVGYGDIALQLPDFLEAVFVSPPAQSTAPLYS